ncbi:dihydropteroate synthase [Alkalibaculum sp. M08DMB]|uniref:Dihydropteroate synthase n=2 Tax=Alkalibaculum sporogenes TaxID=2655001 RepID=A0A6A7K6V6_9FIRM|nr:dihydropteroate synthase [Alkalibaculum sporogenes]MPW25082.1 dihydropteroate synthase [Alkalibaculum sporogenes]
MFDFEDKTYIMGILNITPDSFSDGGDFFSNDQAILHAKEMVELGADIIDVGGESTRPGYEVISDEAEINRVIPIIRALKENINIPVSIDTYKPNVAQAALENGVDMINDIWGFQKDKRMASVVGKYNAPVILMHNQETTEYSGDIMEELISFLKISVEIAMSNGVDRSNIILDPGIGFGKTLEQNLRVMGRLEELKVIGLPILLGTSRKSMIGKILDLPPKERVDGTVATSVIGIMKGTNILRVHDVKENVRAAKVADAILRGKFYG